MVAGGYESKGRIVQCVRGPRLPPGNLEPSWSLRKVPTTSGFNEKWPIFTQDTRKCVRSDGSTPTCRIKQVGTLFTTECE